MTPGESVWVELAPLRNGLVPLTTHADAEWLKQRILPQLQAVIASAPKRLRQRRLFRIGIRSAFVLVLFGMAGSWIVRASADAEATLRVEPLGDSQVVWSDAATELRRLTRADSLPARGKLAALEDLGARLFTSQGVEVELGGHTRVSLEALHAGDQRQSLDLEQGMVRCRVPQLSGIDQFTVNAGSTQVIAHGTVFSVSRAPSDANLPCIRIEQGLVEVRRAGQSDWLRRGQAWGCKSSEARASSGIEMLELDASPRWRILEGLFTQ